MMFIGMFWLVMLVLLVRWMIPLESKRALPEETRRLEGEVERLRDEVDRLSGQVQRLLDEQSFLLRLLDSGEGPPALSRGEDPPPGEPTDPNPLH